MNKKKIKNDSNSKTTFIGHEMESSMIGNFFFTYFTIFGIILIIFALVNYIFKISDPFWLGILAFFISLTITILYYLCQRKKKCKIRMIFNQ